MKSVYVGTLVPNEVITGAFLVVSKDIKHKKSGEPYLSLLLADRTGDIEAKMWDNVAEVMADFDRDDFVKVKGLAQSYQNRLQFTVHRLRRLQDGEVDFDDFFPCAERPSPEMFAELQSIIDGIGNADLRGLLNSVFSDEDIATRFQIAPAAKHIHHACRGGLLEHVLSLCHLCRNVGPHYKQVDVDLLLTGAILHDIGKVHELSYTRSFGYSAEGQLLGHIVIGLQMVAEKFAKLPQFPPRLRTLVEHLILSHHGELEFGSPKTPLFPEAMLLHHLDNLDSKMEAMRKASSREGTTESEFTSWVAALERPVLRKDRYLNGRSVSSANPSADVTPWTAALFETPAAVSESAPVTSAEIAEAPEAPAFTPPVSAKEPEPAVVNAFVPVALSISTPGSRPTPALPVPTLPASAPTAPASAASASHDEAAPRRREERPRSMTLFGEKLQAVLKPGTPADRS